MPARKIDTRSGVSSANPFSDRTQRRQLMDQLRADRNVDKPSGETHEPSLKQPSNEPSEPSEPSAPVSDVAAAGADQAAARDDLPKRSAGDAAGGPGGDNPALALLQAQYAQREAAVQAAENKVREATTLADKRAAEAEAAEQRTEAKLKRLEMVAHDPVQFLVDAGMKEDDFKAYLKEGGQRTPEQKRLAETERQMQAMRAELETIRKETQTARQQAIQEREDAQLAKHLSSSDYALVNQLGGVPIVRQRQAELRQSTGREVSLADTAHQLEKEFTQNLQKMLALDSVRGKLGLTPKTDQPARESKPSTSRTIDGAHASTTSSTSNGAKPAWNDWAAKRAKLQREFARQQRQ